MLDPITSLPLHPIRGILKLVPELHSDLVVREGEQFFTQEVIFLLAPFLLKELEDGRMADGEVVAVTPDAVGGVGLDNALRVTVLETLCQDLLQNGWR